MALLCNSIEKPNYRLESSYFNYTNGGKGQGNICNKLCTNDLICKSWMFDYRGNTCYLSDNINLINNFDNYFSSFLLDRNNCISIRNNSKTEIYSNEHDLNNETDLNNKTDSNNKLCFKVSDEMKGWTLKSYYLDNTNGGKGLGIECEYICIKDLKCNSWMWTDSGNSCYLSHEKELIKKNNNYIYKDHHPFTVDKTICNKKRNTNINSIYKNYISKSIIFMLLIVYFLQ